MKRNLILKVLCATLVLMIAVSLAACNIGGTTDGNAPGVTPAPEATQPAVTEQPMASGQPAVTANPGVLPTENSNLDTSVAAAGDIGVEAAVQAALNRAGLTADQVAIVKKGMELENGRKVYEVEFLYGGKEYDYTIDALTGNVLSFDQDVENDLDPAKLSAAGLIGFDRAGQIALDKVPGATKDDLMIEVDLENGRYQYEGEIYYGGQEYDFAIDAKDGTVLQWKQEPIDR